jgi:nucleoside-diphosphate-sugar epimerase
MAVWNNLTVRIHGVELSKTITIVNLEIRSEAELEDVLSRPRDVLVEFIRSVRSPLVLLGAGGKMGSTLAILARRAAILANHPLEVIAISRFADERIPARLNEAGVRTQRADLLDRRQVLDLPESENVIYLVGLKFGTRDNPSMTWAVNTLVPAMVTERYSKSRIVALSTGNVYPMSRVDSGGARESDPLIPLGEYANAAVARERLFEFMSARYETPISILRLNYAVELRYGVLVDIARKVLSGEPISLESGWFNCIWQGDANEMIIRTLGLTTAPPSVYNLSSPTAISVREVAIRFSELLGRAPIFAGVESPTALLSNTSKLCERLGPPSTTLPEMQEWIAAWLRHQGILWNKPTHFEVRDWQY